jgi:ubiquinone/menaquinone biosynthesis C-methylase UbiE
MSTSDFKNGAWASKESADNYHKNTITAPKIFQLVRDDLYTRYVQRYAQPGARILDLGCGTGLMSVKLHDLGFKVVACDISQGMLDKLAEERGQRDFELRRGSGFEIPAPDGEFDMVISRMFIQHFPDWPKILNEKSRVTRPGGIVLFDFGNREHVDACGPDLGQSDGFPYSADASQPSKFYAVAEAAEMLDRAKQCGLEVVELSPNGLLLYNGFVWKKMGAPTISELNARLDKVLANESARELLFLIEEQVLPLLPKSTCYGNITILRRKSAIEERSRPLWTGLLTRISRLWRRIASDFHTKPFVSL